jgi:UDP-glucose 4-epimerase
MRVLVTGGAGYIGSITVEGLLQGGHHVEILDDLSTGHRAAVPDGVRFHFASYVDAASVETILTDGALDAVLHCGARSLVGESVADPARYYRQNVAGGVALLEGMRLANVRRIVFSSSAAVYGVPEQTPIPEDAPLRPINPYGETKRTFETALSFYAGAYGLRSLSLRYFNAAGASATNGEDHRPETHLIPNVLRAAQHGQPVSIFGADYPTPDGTCVRDYIHVSDLARAHLAALLHLRSGGDSTTLNCAYGHGYSVLEVIEAVKRAAGRDFPVRMVPRRAGDPMSIVATGQRIREVLGWKPQYDDLDTVVAHALAWERRLVDKGRPAREAISA